MNRTWQWHCSDQHLCLSVDQVALTAAASDGKEAGQSKDGVVDMATILKDLGKVKLKPVERYALSEVSF